MASPKNSVSREMISTVMSELGRRGGSKKTPKGFAKLSPAKRTEIAMASVAARKKKRENEKRGQLKK
jgi:hypothetical protein